MDSEQVRLETGWLHNAHETQSDESAAKPTLARCRTGGSGNNGLRLIPEAPSETYLFLRRTFCWILALAVIATGKARRARKRAFQGDVITAVYFHNPQRKLVAKCVRWLLKHGYTFISAGELAAILNEGRSIPPGAVWLSFDDGYKEWMESVFPVIRQYKVPATLFVSPGIISGDRRFPWRTERQSPDATDSLTLDELLTVASFPEIEIGGHTVNHVITTECDPDQLRFEIAVCRSTLQSWTKTAVVSMAYPAGSVDGRERETIIEAGFAIAATTEPSFITCRTDALQTPRFCVPDQASMPEAICNMVGAWRPLIDPLKRLLHKDGTPDHQSSDACQRTLKMRKGLKLSLYKLLNRSGFRFILAASAATFATVRVGKLCKVSYEGEWTQRFPSCTLVEPRLTLWTPKRIEKVIADMFLYQYLPREGDTIVIVGAGTGWETMSFSRSVGVSGRVIAIEAHPRVFRCLSKMRAENQLQNVTLVQAAVADQEREVQLSDFDKHESNSIIGATSGIRVSCTTLDYIFRSFALSRVDFLKMNIEGAERLALYGMGEMVRKTKCVCISCHDFLANDGGPNELRTKADVIAFLKQNGFVVSLRESDGRKFVRDYVYGVNEKLPMNDQAILTDRFGDAKSKSPYRPAECRSASN